MSPYTIRVGREEIALCRRYDAAKAMIAEVREQAPSAIPAQCLNRTTTASWSPSGRH